MPLPPSAHSALSPVSEPRSGSPEPGFNAQSSAWSQPNSPLDPEESPGVLRVMNPDPPATPPPGTSHEAAKTAEVPPQPVTNFSRPFRGNNPNPFSAPADDAGTLPQRRPPLSIVIPDHIIHPPRSGNAVPDETPLPPSTLSCSGAVSRRAAVPVQREDMGVGTRPSAPGPYHLRNEGQSHLILARELARARGLPIPDPPPRTMDVTGNSDVTRRMGYAPPRLEPGNMAGIGLRDWANFRPFDGGTDMWTMPPRGANGIGNGAEPEGPIGRAL